MATMSEYNELVDKVKKYDKLFKEMMEVKLKKEGVIVAGPDKGYYKIKSDGSEIIATSPKFAAKVGQHVIVVDGMIVEVLPESLISSEESTVEFTRINWSDIGGMKSQIESIQKKVEYPHKYKELYKEFKLPSSKGILLYGPPGCGKTMIAKAIASSMIEGTVTQQAFVYVKGGELLSKWVGEAENRIKNMFDSARKTYVKTKKRPIIFIDEAEALLPPRGSRTSSDVDTTIVPTFLSEMDGFEGNNPFVILATNYRERIDEAIQRPGRIDLKIYVGRPSQDDCVDIFKIHLKKTKVLGNMDILAKDAASYLFSVDKLQEEISGALIESIVNLGIENAIVRKINDSKIASGVTLQDIVEATNHH